MAPSSISQGFHPIWLVAVVTLSFAGLARALRGVTLSGAVAGAAVCFVLYYAAGPGAFILLTLLFALTWFATRLGYQRKQKLGTAEKKGGRTASQVLANLGVAAACAATYHWRGNAAYLLAMCAALSEAAADTVSSEVGQSSGGEVRLVTNWRRVPAGTQGGVSLRGTLSGVGAALLVSLAAVLIGLLSPRRSLLSLVAALMGVTCDSYLGAGLESRGILNNNSVNFLGTLTSAAVVGVAIFCI
jgi:uncharacterized protein (TIGR00297 family)